MKVIAFAGEACSRKCACPAGYSARNPAGVSKGIHAGFGPLIMIFLRSLMRRDRSSGMVIWVRFSSPWLLWSEVPVSGRSG